MWECSTTGLSAQDLCASFWRCDSRFHKRVTEFFPLEWKSDAPELGAMADVPNRPLFSCCAGTISNKSVTACGRVRKIRETVWHTNR